MFDKELIKMLGKDKKYLVLVIVLETLEECLSVAFTAFLCFALKDVLDGVREVSGYVLWLSLALGMALLRPMSLT